MVLYGLLLYSKCFFSGVETVSRVQQASVNEQCTGFDGKVFGKILINVIVPKSVSEKQFFILTTIFVILQLKDIKMFDCE